MKKIIAALILSFLCSFYCFSFVLIQPVKAVTVTSTAVTKVGNPTGPGINPNNPASQNIVDYANYLVDAIGTYCGGKVQIANESCLDNIPNLDPQVKSEILSSDRAVPGEPWLQCVGFVSAVLAGATGSPLRPIRNAFLYGDSGANGFTFIPTGTGQMQPGDLVVWNAGANFSSFGHIAVVIGVESDPNYFTVAQANYPNTGIVSIKRFQITGDTRGWLRLQ